VLGENRGFANKCEAQPKRLTYDMTGWRIDLQENVLNDTYRKVKVFTRLRQNNQSWYAQ